MYCVFLHLQYTFSYMTEKHFLIESSDPALFYGANNANLRLLRALCPKLRIVARDNVVRVIGSEEDMAAFDETFAALDRHCAKFNRLTEEDIINILKHRTTESDANSDTIVYSTGGRPIAPRSANQRKLVEAFRTNDMLFAVGPAGSGKTYTAIALAVRALKNKEVKKLILSRPAVEAGEKLGFLPGDMKEKIDPYLRPLYDALFDMLGAESFQKQLERGNIEVAPLAYMRGRTLDDSFIILGEAQNTSLEQMKMFLTRLGFNSKMVVTGDITQIDLPDGRRSGLVDAVKILKDVDDIQIVRFNERDVVRHKLVQDIIKAYEKHEDVKKRK